MVNSYDEVVLSKMSSMGTTCRQVDCSRSKKDCGSIGRSQPNRVVTMNSNRDDFMLNNLVAFKLRIRSSSRSQVTSEMKLFEITSDELNHEQLHLESSYLD